MLVAVEELSELTTVLCKALADKPYAHSELITEIADCTIMLDILSYAMVEENDLSSEIQFKLQRFSLRLDELQNTNETPTDT